MKTTDTEKKPRKKYTKKPFVLSSGEGRPDGLNFKRAEIIEYDGKVYHLTKVERYILDGFVYYSTNDKESVKKSGRVFDTACRLFSGASFERFLELRAVELTLFKLTANMMNEVFLSRLVTEQMTALEKKTERTEEEQEALEDFRLALDFGRLKVEIIQEAVADFLKAHDVPDFLVLDFYADASKSFLFVPVLLVDTLKDTLNAHELRKMYDLYLKQTFDYEKEH